MVGLSYLNSHKNKLSEEEYQQAQEVVQLRGGHIEGQTKSDTPGIDGYLDQKPISLKQYSGESPLGVLKHATRAESQVIEAGLNNIDVYINAKNVSSEILIDFAKNGPLVDIPTQRYISNIYVQTSDGWILIRG